MSQSELPAPAAEQAPLPVTGWMVAAIVVAPLSVIWPLLAPLGAGLAIRGSKDIHGGHGGAGARRLLLAALMLSAMVCGKLLLALTLVVAALLGSIGN